MLFYLITIVVAIVSVTLFHGFFMSPIFSEPQEMLWTLLYLVIGTVAVIAIDGLEALIIRRLNPESWYMPGKKLFVVSKKEVKFCIFYIL